MIEERIDNRMSYKESIEDSPGGKRRICALYDKECEEPVSKLSLLSFHIRMGETSVAAEGYGGVQTLPLHRGKGHITTLMNRSLIGVSERVNVAFLYGIEGLYQKFGFTSCLRESSITVWTGRTQAAAVSPELTVRDASPADFPELARVYNTAHRLRPWTVVRSPESADHIRIESPWRPSPEILTVSRGSELVGYAAIAGKNFGDNSNDCVVLEAASLDQAASEALLSEIGRRCREREIFEFSVSEPSDSVFAKTAARLGCSEKWNSSPDGGGMAAVLNRKALIQELKDEFVRRYVAAHRWIGSDGANESKCAEIIDRLAARAIVPEDADLVRLILGFWSWEDAGLQAPATDLSMLRALFPGGGTPILSIPYSHRFDRY